MVPVTAYNGFDSIKYVCAFPLYVKIVSSSSGVVTTTFSIDQETLPSEPSAQVWLESKEIKTSYVPAFVCLLFAVIVMNDSKPFNTTVCSFSLYV